MSDLSNKHEIGSIAQVLFDKFGTRMWRKEKDSFLSYCEQEFRNLGYEDGEIQVQEGKSALGLKCKNLIVGNPNADVLVTAHYDTPAKNGFIFSFQPIVGETASFIIFPFAFFVLFMVIGNFVSRILGVLQFEIVHLGAWLGISMTVVSVLGFFIRNKYNHTDNTSGVLGVFDVAKRMAQNPELKSKTAFVLFDHEEIFLPGLSFGCLGSRLFAKWRKENFPNKEIGKVINLDCIGNADVLTVISKKKNPICDEVLSHFQEKDFNPKQLYSGGADHSSFECGVSLIYQKRSLLGPLYIPNMHTNRDRICNIEQVERLGEAVHQYLTEKV